MEDKNNKRLNWPVARVVAIHPGKDGEIRTATIKVKLNETTAELLRPVKTLIPLEIRRNETNATKEVSSNKNILPLKKSSKQFHLDGQNLPSTSDKQIPQTKLTRSGRRVKAPSRLEY